MSFNSGGAIEFGQALLQAGKIGEQSGMSSDNHWYLFIYFRFKFTSLQTTKSSLI